MKFWSLFIDLLYFLKLLTCIWPVFPAPSETLTPQKKNYSFLASEKSPSYHRYRAWAEKRTDY